MLTHTCRFFLALPGDIYIAIVQLKSVKFLLKQTSCTTEKYESTASSKTTFIKDTSLIYCVHICIPIQIPYPDLVATKENQRESTVKDQKFKKKYTQKFSAGMFKWISILKTYTA